MGKLQEKIKELETEIDELNDRLSECLTDFETVITPLDEIYIGTKLGNLAIQAEIDKFIEMIKSKYC